MRRSAATRLSQSAARRLLSDLLRGKRYADSVAAVVLVDLCCFGVLDDVLGAERTPAARAKIEARYQEIFADTVIGIYEDLLDGRRRSFPSGFYTGQQGAANAAILVRNLVENVLEMPIAKVPERFNKRLFERHRLMGPVGAVLRGSPWLAADAAYPGRFHPWELKIVPQGLWSGPGGRKHAIEATRWLFETKLGWPLDRIAERTSKKLFDRHGLGGMLLHVYDASPFRALDAAYPGRFRPWQLPNVPLGYWTGRHGRRNSIAATRWLLEDELSWDDEQIKRQLTCKSFIKHRLGGMMSKRYRQQVCAALEEAYPGRFMPWELRERPLSMWAGRAGRSLAVEATRWLVETALGWNEATVRLCLTGREFDAHGLSNMITDRYGGSVWAALEQAYPGRYRKDELFGYRRQRGVHDRLMHTLLARVRILTDAGRMDAAAVCRRHRISTQRLRVLRERFATDGIAGLLPEPKTPVIGVDVQRAVLDLTRKHPSLSAAETSRRLRARGVEVRPAEVTRVWRSHHLLEAKERLRLVERVATYPTIAAAARALGESTFRIHYNRRRLRQGGFAALCHPTGISREAEAAILALAREEPALGRPEILRTLRARGTVVTEQGISTVLTRYGLRTAAQRLAAGGGLANVVRDLAGLEPMLRTVLGSWSNGRSGGRASPSRRSRRRSTTKKAFRRGELGVAARRTEDHDERPRTK